MATMASHGRHSTHGSISYIATTDPLPGPSSPLDVPMKPSYSPGTSSFPTDVLSTSGPLPNPPFIFPARQSPSSAPSSFSRATGRRPKSAFDLKGPGPGFSTLANSQGKSVPPPLPSFSFGTSSGAAPVSPDSGITSPPKSPISPGEKSILRAAGHRRGGSEFIGGDGKTGTGTILMSTSPTKTDEDQTAQTGTASLGPSAGRRGHAHRRSAAISCHDLSMILKPTSVSGGRGGSAPTSPSENENQRFNFPIGSSHGLTNSISDPNIVPRLPGSSPPDSPKREQTRARVGFSETLEFIPRPLSLVSSDTSSTATMRPGHSVSGSITSIMSAGAPSPPAKDPRGLPSPAQSIINESRPSTAGAVLDFGGDSSVLGEDAMDVKRRNSVPFAIEDLGDTSPTLAAQNKASRKYVFFGHSDGETSPTRSRPGSAASSDKPKINLSGDSSPVLLQDKPETSIEILQPTQQRRPSLTRKPSKKPKKVRSWAGSILSRKTRPRSVSKSKSLSRRSPTPPLRNYDAYELQPPISTQPTIEESIHHTSPPPMPQLTTNFASWKPRQVAPQDDDTMSPIIDLDAALGPFNTPTALSYDPAWEASQHGGRTQKKRMHSNGLARGYRSTDNTFHRRSESAPEMDNPRFQMNRPGSSFTMADVFEEDEEDDWEETKSVSHKSSKAQIDEDETVFALNATEFDPSPEAAVMDWATVDALEQRGIKRKGSGLSEGDRRQVSGSSAKSVHSTTSLMDEPIAEETESSIELTNSSYTMRDESDAKSSLSTLTPPLRGHVSPKGLAPVEINSTVLPQPFLTPASPGSTFQSPFPSPRSPMSYDAQRISTAPSSFTDENTFESLLLGEPGPEVRMSVDDVPSLTSSTSTMTRESMNASALNNHHFRNGQRSVSLSAPSVTRKRSSIASLSRLLHSSHGEKSPLSSELTAPSSPEKKEKRGKRLSRMMNFFKPKDTPSAS